MVADEVGWSGVSWERLDFGRRMPGHGDPQRSIAAIASAFLRRNVRQVCDGGPRWRITYLETVELGDLEPKLEQFKRGPGAIWCQATV